MGETANFQMKQKITLVVSAAKKAVFNTLYMIRRLLIRKRPTNLLSITTHHVFKKQLISDSKPLTVAIIPDATNLIENQQLKMVRF